MNARSILTLLLAAPALALAGPLDPPAGPIAPTPGPEPRIAINAANTPGDADSLFKITQPGSYYLTGNITGVAAKHGIEIVASGVTIDLNGFDLVGVSGSLDGVIASTSNITNIAILNGSARSWGGDGIDLALANPSNGRLDAILASNNAGGGIRVSGAFTFTNCSASGNTGNGLYADYGSTFVNCVASFNGGNGIIAGGTCTITGCSTYFNSQDGIYAITASTIATCSAGFNAGDGIQVLGDCTVRENTCDSNGNGGDGAGIHVLSGSNRIENNNCSDSRRGIDVDAAGNIIIRNTCSGNFTNWDIVANNVYGPIIDRTAPASAAVVGNAAASTLGSTDPNANFSY
jgi:parallel beta-helix repeat protein